MANKTGGPLKGIFDPAKRAAAGAVMGAQAQAPAARNRKAGGRNARISGYIPPETEEALRDEVIKRTVAERKTVSLNDVLCDALEFWRLHGRDGQ